MENGVFLSHCHFRVHRQDLTRDILAGLHARILGNSAVGLASIVMHCVSWLFQRKPSFIIWNAKLQSCHIVRFWRLDGKVWWAGWRIAEGTQKAQLRNAPIEQLAQIHIGYLYLCETCLVRSQRLSKLLDERCGHKTAKLHSTSSWSI